MKFMKMRNSCVNKYMFFIIIDYWIYNHDWATVWWGNLTDDILAYVERCKNLPLYFGIYLTLVKVKSVDAI